MAKRTRQEKRGQRRSRRRDKRFQKYQWRLVQMRRKALLKEWDEK